MEITEFICPYCGKEVNNKHVLSYVASRIAKIGSKKMTAEQRTERARQAAMMRWKK